MNRTDPLVMQPQEQAKYSTLLSQQTNRDSQKTHWSNSTTCPKDPSNQRKTWTTTANIATSVWNSSIQEQILASISTGRSLVTREEIQLMFANFTKNFPSQTTCAEIYPTGTKLSVEYS